MSGSVVYYAVFNSWLKMSREAVEPESVSQGGLRKMEEMTEINEVAED